MRFFHLLALGALIAHPSAAEAQAAASGDGRARALVTAALDAIGGEAAARALTVLEAEGVQVGFLLGQEMTPNSALSTTGRRLSITSDWAENRVWQRIEGQGFAGPYVVRQFVAPGGAVLDVNGAISPLPSAPATTVRRGLRVAPQRLLLAALEPGSVLAPLDSRTWEGRRQAGVRLVTATDTAGLWFDAERGELAGFASWSDDPILGDRTTYVALDGWTTLPGHKLRLPAEMRTYVNGRLVTVQTLVRMEARAATPDSLFAVPDSLRGSQSSDPSAVAVRLTELATGVWYVTGGTHHSLAVGQGDSIVLLEAPVGPAWMRAVLDTLAARFPAAPVRLAVNTHHHWDHAGGVRTALGAGIPVFTHANNVAFLREIGRARKTLAPDGVERHGGRHVVRGVRDSLAIGGGDRRVVLYGISNRHVEGMLVSHLPGARLLFVADLAPQGPDRRTLLELIRAHRLEVERIVGTHGAVTSFADFERTTLADG